MSKSWKSTLRLPRSSFPARPNPKLQPLYLRDCSDTFYQWQTDHRPKDDPFVLHDGPPYANGPLHTGHALNKILKDMILRVQVQGGRRVIYRPSWDCHGLPIEMKALQGSSAHGLSPIKVRESARRLASQTVSDQMKGFQSFAVMGDWDNRWTTMDRAYEIRQLRVFQKMVRSGLVYRKHRPVYWSISSRTALAEAELEYRDDHVSHAAYVRFRVTSDWTHIPGLEGLAGPLYAAIWTTTPWTLPANQAIAVNDDILYAVLRVGDYGLLVAESRVEEMQKNLPPSEVIARAIPGGLLKGLQYRNKLRGRAAPAQPVIHADFVTAESGTGLVHLAPGHGQDDYHVCSALGIEAFAPITDEGRFTREAFPDDPDRLASAPGILEGGGQAVLDLVGEDVLWTHKLQHKYPYDWRTKKPVVIRAMAQWFADVGAIKQDALQAIGQVRFVPESGRARLESFIKGRSEWCISRQRSWGVPIPALYDEAGDAVMTDESIEHMISVIEQRGMNAWFSDSPDDPAWVPTSLSGKPYSRGMDTMDVWFDSGTSWTEIGRPVDVYLEGSDQHRGWFQSSLLTFVAAQRADGKTGPEIVAPFGTLITHGFTLDGQGKKMSKSLGNTIGPVEVMDGKLLPPLKAKGGGGGQHDALGPDALRLWTASGDFTSDVQIGASVLQPIHNSLVKYRTILKMLLGSLHPPAGRAPPLTKLDQIALMQLQDVMGQVWEAYGNYEFHRATGLINRWVATDFSAFYLEGLKDRLYCGDGGGALVPIFAGFLRMLAPITPMLVEEAWSHRPAWMAEDGLLEHPARQLYNAPIIDADRLTVDQGQMREDLPVISAVHDAVKAGLEQAREAKALGSSLQCSLTISVDDGRVAGALERYLDELDAIFVVSSVDLNGAAAAAAAAANTHEGECETGEANWCYSKEFEVGGTKGVIYVRPPKQSKCSRCWRYLAEQEDGLCGRCEDVVAAHA
ncbi:Isoleucine--tRNA ligase [Escovopsis weberi]|uniref:Isoleucine--tRNA ligase, mitochondrial n=1 Tax=Escovopsis weberi TaxID=150374 RepID=A0A0M8MXW8_ESCWE|nr:Isoleucine--tRNA ligase [Escovopsis weberi]